MNVVAESVLARKANRLISEIAAIRSTKKVLKASVSSLIAEGSDNGIVEPKMQWQAIVTAASNNHLSLLAQDWRHTMAVNILGTVQAQKDGSGGFKLPSATLFNSSIEPLSIISFFSNKRWCHLRKFMQAVAVGSEIFGVECVSFSSV